MRHDPEEIVHGIGDALRKLPSGETARINDVAKNAMIHWVTAQRYLGLIQFIQTSVPKIEILEAGDSRAVKVTGNPWLDSMEADQASLVRLLDLKAISKETAVPPPGSWTGALQEAERKGLVKSTEEGNFYLSAKGVSHALKSQSSVVDSFDEAFKKGVAKKELEELDQFLVARMEELVSRYVQEGFDLKTAKPETHYVVLDMLQRGRRKRIPEKPAVTLVTMAASA